MRDGEPVADVVPTTVNQRWEQERQALFDEMRAVSARVNLSEEQAEAIVAQAISNVRAQTRAADR